ncbi:unnamed protein product [Notodromas monacha]|uniref:Uncharacterized protein n=1 Tax=Notodromas monacha TaxID=399045 RepID=A0A7R9GBB6_9CRUS|nr:unnamed protein product [Notodromas monacha]CAG0914840.1 unnamed protein product [Notodromas monacha]
MPTSVVSYRSPFDGDVDPGLPPWKRDLILRRRAMSRTLGTPLTGTLDVASILAMSRSSSGGITGIVRNPPERATNSTKQRMAEPKERAKDTDKPKPASKNMSQPGKEQAPPAFCFVLFCQGISRIRTLVDRVPEQHALFMHGGIRSLRIAAPLLRLRGGCATLPNQFVVISCESNSTGIGCA